MPWGCSQHFKGKACMKAVGYKKPLQISDAESLLDIEVPTPTEAGVTC
jgi:hypothetical protein